MRTTPLRLHLLVLVLAALLPMAVLTVWLTSALLTGERERGERDQLQTARAIFFAVEAEMDRTIAALQALALHESLRRGELESFRPAAEAARATLTGWNNVLVIGPNAEHLLNVRRPPGEPLPKLGDTANVLETVRTRKPYISHTIAAASAPGQPFIAITVPVVVNDEVKYVLLATMTAAHWSQWLAQRAPENSPVAIIDRDFVIFARSKDGEKTSGTPVQPWYREILQRELEGVVRGRGVLHSDVRPAFVRSQRTGLTVNLVASGEVVDAPLRRARAVLMGGLAAAFGIALLLAFWRARVLTRGIDVMRHALESLRAEEPRIQPGATAVTEMNEALLVARETAGALRERQESIRQLQSVLHSRVMAAEADARRKDEFLATLAHELRNPLAPIVNALEVMRRAGGASSSAEKGRAIVERQVRHMVRLVDDLLDLGRVNTGKIQLRMESLEVAEVVRLALEAVKPVYDAANIRLAADPPAPGMCVEGDKVRLTQVLVNLLTNAAKFSPAHATVRLKAFSESGKVLLEVQDEGVGLEACDLERIFEMFSQVRRGAPSHQGGLGIGLALVRSLVHAHGGSVTARSAGLGHGSVFVVSLPQATARLAGMPLAASAADGASPGRLRILVVDDNTDSVETLRMLLGMLGHEVHTAFDGQQAVDKALLLKPDVVLMDIGMPALSGHEACKRIRQAAGASMRIVAISGWGQPRDRELSREAGFDAHLIKPIDPAALAALLDRVPQRLTSA